MVGHPEPLFTAYPADFDVSSDRGGDSDECLAGGCGSRIPPNGRSRRIGVARSPAPFLAAADVSAAHAEQDWNVPGGCTYSRILASRRGPSRLG
jgi:hypothetical protein